MIAESGTAQAKRLRPEQSALDNRLLTTLQAAKRLGVSPAFLARDRWQGARIPFVRISSRLVRYRLADLLEYIDRNTHGPKQAK
jgi:hypothetical protein